MSNDDDDVEVEVEVEVKYMLYIAVDDVNDDVVTGRMVPAVVGEDDDMLVVAVVEAD
jgi:hypothetical protein